LRLCSLALIFFTTDWARIIARIYADFSWGCSLRSFSLTPGPSPKERGEVIQMSFGFYCRTIGDTTKQFEFHMD
jgi:hypothetical protein